MSEGGHDLCEKSPVTPLSSCAVDMLLRASTLQSRQRVEKAAKVRRRCRNAYSIDADMTRHDMT